MKRFDLFFKSKPDVENVFEFKYIKNGSTRKEEEKQRIFNDLMRLYLYLCTNHHGFFLICGNGFEFKTNFQNYKLRPAEAENTYIKTDYLSSAPSSVTSTGFYTEWFHFDNNNPKCIIDLSKSKEEYATIYKTFLEEHSKPYFKKTSKELKLPETIVTNLVFLSQSDYPIRIGIWEVTTT